MGSGPVVSTVLKFPTIVHTAFPYGPGDNIVGVPLSTQDPALKLLVNLSTGMCLRTEPVLEFELFAPAPTTGNGTQIVEEVPCSLLEGAPLEQIQEQGGPLVCTHAAGLLVAACVAQTGGIGMVDATGAAVQKLCAPTVTPTDKPFQVVTAAGEGTGGFLACVRVNPGDDVYALEVVSPGRGFRENDRLFPANRSATNKNQIDQMTALSFRVRVQKMIWQPSSSSMSVASAPIVSVATEVVNTSALFDVFGEDSLFAIFAAEVGSATASYVWFGIECGIIFSGVTFQVYKLFKGRQPRRRNSAET